MLSKLIHLIISLTLFSQASRIAIHASKHFANPDYSLIERSKASYSELVRMGSFNPCVRDAMDLLNCRTMTDMQQTGLALKLTNCELAKFGKKEHRCGVELTLKECSGKLKGDAWTTYSTIKSHLENTCFYQHSLIWQQESEQTINTLMRLTSVVVDTAEDTNERTKYLEALQSRVEQLTKANLELQSDAVRRFNETSLSMDAFNERILHGFDRILRMLTDQEQNFLQFFQNIIEDLQFIKNLQMWLVYDSFDWKGAALYMILLFVITFVTSYRRFLDLNFTLKICLVVNYFTERAIFEIIKSTSLPYNESLKLSSTIIVYERLLFIGICFIMLYRQFKNYVDLQKQILVEVQLVSQRLARDTPKMKGIAREELYTLLKGSISKIFPTKKANPSSLNSSPHVKKESLSINYPV